MHLPKSERLSARLVSFRNNLISKNKILEHKYGFYLILKVLLCSQLVVALESSEKYNWRRGGLSRRSTDTRNSSVS